MKKFLKVLLYSHLFLGVSVMFSQCTFKYYAKRSYERAEKEKPYDVIIVPGIPYDKEKTSSVMKMRIFWAKHLYDNGFAKNIIFSGSAVYTHFVEGVAMKVIADSLGIPSDHTFSETTAEHSTENIYYSWKMAKEMGFQKIALATDPFQSYMLRSFVKKYCPGVKSIPIVFGKIDMDKKTLPLIDTTKAYVANFVSIKEREGFWKRLKGTMGKRIKDEQKLEARKPKNRGTESNE
jgi:uncharacterized SAM-binding protein YcdF (DUF218 family)